MADEFDQKPFDRALVDAFGDMCRVGDPVGPTTVLDAGCGPGYAAGRLTSSGTPAIGIDLSPRMIEAARKINPEIPYHVGSVLDLPYGNGEFAGVLSLYSIIHLPPEPLRLALSEFHRVLAPGGRLLLAFHVGEGTLHLDEWFGRRVDLDGYLLHVSDVVHELAATGFDVESETVRRPIPEIEVPTERAYLLARRS